MTSVRIVVFAKAPVPGFAKTRLIPALGSTGASRLAARMIEFTLSQAIEADVGPVELCATPRADLAEWQCVDFPFDVELTEQGDGDLGRRLSAAAHRVLAGGTPALFIGADCPQLTAEKLRAAAEDLGRVDAVVTPAFDGGYALLGLRRFDDLPFRNISWSTPAVARETLARLEALGWLVIVQPALRDIDEPADLRWLPHEWPESTHA